MTELRDSPVETPTVAAGTDLAIEVHGLRKRFGRTDVLQGIDLAVPRNSVFGFLGPNGAGKSTTMKILVGLLRPTAGSARWSATTCTTTASPPEPASATCPRTSRTGHT